MTKDPHSIRLAGTLLAILSYTLREMPENADLVEKIVFDEKMDLLVFLRHSNKLLKYRTCMLLRLLGRFSCYALQTKWTMETREAVEALLTDPDEQTRKVSKIVTNFGFEKYINSVVCSFIHRSVQEAEATLDEFKQLSFYTPTKAHSNNKPDVN